MTTIFNKKFISEFEYEADYVCGHLRFEYDQLDSHQRIRVIDDKDIDDPIAVLGTVQIGDGSSRLENVHEGDLLAEEILAMVGKVAYDLRGSYVQTGDCRLHEIID